MCGGVFSTQPTECVSALQISLLAAPSAAENKRVFLFSKINSFGQEGEDAHQTHRQIDLPSPACFDSGGLINAFVNVYITKVDFWKVACGGELGTHAWCLDLVFLPVK